MFKTFDWFNTIATIIMMVLVFGFVTICSAVAGTLVFVVTLLVCSVSFIFVIWGFVCEYKLSKRFE